MADNFVCIVIQLILRASYYGTIENVILYLHILIHANLFNVQLRDLLNFIEFNFIQLMHKRHMKWKEYN